MKDTEFITKSIAFIQELYDLYEDAQKYGDREAEEWAYPRYIACSSMLEEVTGLEVYPHNGKIVVEDPDRDLTQDDWEEETV